MYDPAKKSVSLFKPQVVKQSVGVHVLKMAAVKDEQKVLSLSGYSDLEFMDDVTDYQCRHCQTILLDDHYMSPCGHFFCFNCKTVLEGRGQYDQWQCLFPTCQQRVYHLYHSVEFNKKVNALRLCCPNKKLGCTFVDSVKIMAEHVNQCEKKPNNAELKVTKKKSRKPKPNNQRPRNGAPKSFNMVYKEMLKINKKIDSLNEGLNVVTDMIIQLDKVNDGNKTSVDTAVKDLKSRVNSVQSDLQVVVTKLNTVETFQGNHKQETCCEKYDDVIQKIQTDQQNLASDFQAFKTQEDSKINIPSELLYQIEKQMDPKRVKSLKQKTETADMKLKSVTEPKKMYTFPSQRTSSVINLSEQNVLLYSWKIEEISSKMALKTFDLESPVFPFSDYNCGAKVRMELKENDVVYMSLCLTDAKKDFQPLDLKVIPQIIYIVRGRPAYSNQKDVVRRADYGFSSSLPYETYCYDKKILLKSRLLQSVYAIGDILVVDIMMESPSVEQKANSDDGVLMWKVRNYSRMKNAEKHKLVTGQHIPDFYTGSGGYRIRVVLHLDGSGSLKNKGLTAQIKFLAGKFDSVLSKSFKHQTTVTVINQKDASKHLFVMSENDVLDKSSYHIDIAPHSVIENDGFVLNDTLICKVAIAGQTEDDISSQRTL